MATNQLSPSYLYSLPLVESAIRNELGHSLPLLTADVIFVLLGVSRALIIPNMCEKRRQHDNFCIFGKPSIVSSLRQPWRPTAAEIQAYADLCGSSRIYLGFHGISRKPHQQRPKNLFAGFRGSSGDFADLRGISQLLVLARGEAYCESECIGGGY